MTPADNAAEVEVVARALYDLRPMMWDGYAIPWEDGDAFFERGDYRGDATAAISALDAHRATNHRPDAPQNDGSGVSDE